MENLDKIKGGDLTHLRKNPAILNTANAILGEMRDLKGYGINDARGKLANQVDRLAELKVNHIEKDLPLKLIAYFFAN